jgi:hypothetical protein
MTRPVLSLRPKAEIAPASAANDPQANAGERLPASEAVTGAIMRRMCLRARYNGGEVVLQPSLLYREHDALFLLAVTVSRDGKPPREPKLGTFRLSGLTDLGIAGMMFEPAELHRSYNSQPGWEVLAGPVRPAVERGTRTISARTGPAPSQ